MTPPAVSLEAVLLGGAVTLLALSGAPGLVAKKGGPGAERLAAWLTGTGSLLGLVAAVRVLAAGATVRASFPSPLPGGPVVLAADPLSALFLLPVFLVPPLAAVFGLGYWPEAEHRREGRRHRLFLGFLAASMATVVLARTGVTFLVAWEVMALSAFFAATAEDRQPTVREAGWVYLVATHAGTLGLFGMTALLARMTGGFLWEVPTPLAATSLPSATVFLLALLGFGLKAGLFPFHFWLPGAHAAAPSHASALMSGVMLKMGLYGLFRITSLFAPPPSWWGVLLLVLGAASALYGAFLAAGQGDVKRLLAYSSIENVGVITTGLALGLLGRALSQPAWVALGIGGACLHVLFHALFKPLLFLGAGAVIHATGTREMDRMGGLLARMPVAGTALAIGAATASALPPLNGFFSEFLIYLGLLRAVSAPGGSILAGLAAPALALAGGVVLAAFVKAAGVVLLGNPRSEKAGRAHEPGPAMLAPIVLLAAACVLSGLLLPLLAPVLDGVARAWGGARGAVPLREAAPVLPVAVFAAAFLSAVVLAALVVGFGFARRRSSRGPTWDCGYASPTARMQYTGRSFADWLSERLPPRSLAPPIEPPRVEGLFPRTSRFSSETPPQDPLSRGLFEPFMTRWADRFADLHRLQEGRLAVYLVYVLGTLVVLLAWSAFRGYFPAR